MRTDPAPPSKTMPTTTTKMIATNSRTGLRADHAGEAFIERFPMGDDVEGVEGVVVGAVRLTESYLRNCGKTVVRVEKILRKKNVKSQKLPAPAQKHRPRLTANMRRTPKRQCFPSYQHQAMFSLPSPFFHFHCHSFWIYPVPQIKKLNKYGAPRAMMRRAMLSYLPTIICRAGSFVCCFITIKPRTLTLGSQPVLKLS